MKENLGGPPLKEPEIEPVKGWTKIALSAGLGLVLTIGLIFVGYQLGQQKSQPIPSSLPKSSPSPTSDLTANWKTYTNSLNHYSLKYPSNQQAILDSSDPYIGVCGLGKSDISIRLYSPDKSIPSVDPEFSGNLALAIKTINNLGKYSVQEWVNQNCQGTWLVVNATQEKVTINGVSEAIKYTGSEFKNTSSVVLSKDDKLFFIYAYSGNPTYQISQTLNQILSTFKFISQKGSNIEIPSNWRQYKAKGLNVSFYYPPDFNISETPDSVRISKSDSPGLWSIATTAYNGESRRQWYLTQHPEFSEEDKKNLQFTEFATSNYSGLLVTYTGSNYGWGDVLLIPQGNKMFVVSANSGSLNQSFFKSIEF